MEEGMTFFLPDGINIPALHTGLLTTAAPRMTAGEMFAVILMGIFISVVRLQVVIQ
jgi:hypothetical protein